MNITQANKPIRLNLDKSKKYLGRDEAFYLLNHDVLTVLGKATPKPANFPLCDLQKPAGENYSVGEYWSPLTRELYSWTLNSNGVHFIQRVNSEGECEIVYVGCLLLGALPRHKITQFRAFMKVDKLCANVHGKQLIWTYGEGPIYQLDVEASIATNYFDTPFFRQCSDPCDLIRMCVPDPCGCLQAEFLPVSPDDAEKRNAFLDTGYKLSFRHVYYDNRTSIWANPTTLYYQNSRGCFDTNVGFPRCLKVRIPVGNPLVDRIELAYTKDGANWSLSDIIEKYKKYNSSQQYWYERGLSEQLSGYSADDCAFDYIFCDDKLCQPVDPTTISRVFNPIPRDAQCLIPVGLSNQDNPALGVVNYRQGNCPIDKGEAQKFDVQLDCSESGQCPREMVTVTVRAIIHNGFHNRNQFIYTTSANKDTDTAYFGGLNPALDGGFEIGYDQYFNEKTRNFIAYVEGTDYWGEMKQRSSASGFTQTKEHGTVSDMSEGSVRNSWRRFTRNGGFFYQEVEIKVLKGTKGFLRLASHHATGNEPATSTFVGGILNDIRNYRGDRDLSGIVNGSEEIYFDACNGDVDVKAAFVITDNAIDDGGTTPKASAYFGYIRDNNDNPVEGARLFLNVFGGIILGGPTDHNGFYHFFILPGADGALELDILVEKDCYEFKKIQTMSVEGQRGFNTGHDETITDEAWTNSFYANVQMGVKDCQGFGVSGIRIALSGSKYKVTGPDGVAHWRIRNYMDRHRALRAIVMNHQGCINTDCGGVCSPCMHDSNNLAPLCFFEKPTISLETATISIDRISDRGLKSGGRYPFGFYLRGDCGRISAVYETKYLDIPRVQVTGKEGFCKFRFDGHGINLSGWDCLEIVRGENVNPFELQWVVDKITRTSDSKIKLTIQSLNDYNEKFFFKTNTVYSWLAGDRVEFVKNGDGSIMTVSQFGLLNYLTVSPFHDSIISGKTDAPADYFNQLIIEDDGRLDSLTEGAVLEIQRPRTCADEPPYFSICASIPIKSDGTLAVDSGTFETFDTYFVNRSIGQLPPYRFEHHSISDFWGTRLTDTGRAYFVNKFENERRYGRNISINAPNEFNFFGDTVKTFNQHLHGDIIGVGLLDDKIGMCISEHDNSLFEVGSDLLRVGGDGIVRALSADQVISDPQPKVVGQFGCSYEAVGSIFFGDGYATWVDVSRRSLVVHNYQFAKAIDEGKIQTWLLARCRDIEVNRTAAAFDQLRFAVGIHSRTKAICLTLKSLRHSGIYNEAAPLLKPNETISFLPASQEILGFESPTPEGYGQYDGANVAFIAYLNGVPYVHPVTSDRYNEFFGVACDWIIGIAINDNARKLKSGLAMEVQSDTMWFVKEVTTDRLKYRSEIPPVKWIKGNRKWNAAFLGNINGRGGLHASDEPPTGYFISVLLVRDNTDALKYNTVNNTKRITYSELDEIIFKFMAMEQSGFEVNV